MLKVVPLSLFPSDAFHIWPAATAATGGASIGGPAQTTDWSGGGLLMGTLEGVVLWTPAQFLTWRALLMHARGGGELIMPIIDWPNRPFPEGMEAAPPVPFSDGSGFSDGSLFATTTLDYRIEEAALEGDVMVRIRRVTGAPLGGAHWFTLVHPTAGPRAYAIEHLGEEDEDQVRDVWFGCPLREDTPADAFADFENPRTVMTIVSAPEDAWPKMTPPFEATVGFRFAESFEYLYAVTEDEEGGE